MPFVDRRGLSFHTQVLGSGPPLVMIHGLLLGSMATWYFSAAPRLARTHRVLLFDLRGHGKTTRTASGYDLATMTEDLSALLADFTAEPATLVGHSWGALLALRLAITDPERARRLALVEAPLPPSRQGDVGAFLRLPLPELAGLLPATVRGEIARGGRAATSFLTRLRELSERTTLLKDLEAEGDFADEALAGVACPTLLVYGDRSRCRPTGDRLARVMENARLQLLPGGHDLPAEAGAALADTLAEWCDA